MAAKRDLKQRGYWRDWAARNPDKAQANRNKYWHSEKGKEFAANRGEEFRAYRRKRYRKLVKRPVRHYRRKNP